MPRCDFTTFFSENAFLSYIRGTAPSLYCPQGPANPLNHTRHLHSGSLGHKRDHSSPWSPQAPSILLNSTRHLHLRSLGHTRDCTLTAEPTSAHKLPNHTRHLHCGPQMPTYSLNHTKHLHCGHTRGKPSPMENTSANKPLNRTR